MADGLFFPHHHTHHANAVSDQFDTHFADQPGHDVLVKDYFRQDGTHVKAHFQSDADGNPFNNYSYPGNVNPYTGEIADGNPVTYLQDHGYFDQIMTHSDPLNHVRGFVFPPIVW